MGWLETPRGIEEFERVADEEDERPLTAEDIEDARDALASLAEPDETISLEELGRELGL